MTTQHPVYLIAAWIGIGLIGLALLIMASRGDWRATLVLGGFLALSVAFVSFRRRLPNLFDLLFVATTMLNAAGYVWNLFTRLAFYDEFAHGLTAFSLSLALGFLLYGSVVASFRHHRPLFVVVIASLGISAGALWEIFEFATNMRSGLGDTIWDLIYDSLGAIAGGLVALALLPRHLNRTARPSNG